MDNPTPLTEEAKPGDCVRILQPSTTSGLLGTIFTILPKQVYVISLDEFFQVGGSNGYKVKSFMRKRHEFEVL